MKKFLSLVLALIMTMSLVTISAGATEYRDLTDKDEIQYEEAVAVLNRIGVITGYEDGSFRPETELTRGAAAKIIVSLMIGPEAASALPNNASSYPDVPAGHTFAGVIGYCKTAGYISGYGDGTFKPANPLTGYAFAKMLLGAVGYKGNIEGFVDTGWTMNVARIGNVAGLFDRISFDGAKAVTRDEACQLALNTLKATMVDYGSANTVVSSSGEVLTVQGSKAVYVTSNNRDINANINRRVISATNNELTLEFGEEHFKDLRLEHDRYDPAYDIYGHPSNEWSYKKVTIGTFKLPADYTFTKQMAHLEDTVATKEKALGLRGYDTYSTDHRGGYVNWSTAASNAYGSSPFADATQIHINGWNARVLNSDLYKQTTAPASTKKGQVYTYDARSIGSANKDLAPSLSELCDLTDNGVTVEVYVCPVDADFITDVVVTRTQLMEVDRVASDFVELDTIGSDSDDPRKDGKLEEIAGYNDYALWDEVASVKDNNYDAYNVLKELKSGDEVAVIPYTTDDGKTWEVGEAYVPETVSGALTNVDIYNTRSKADGNAIAITVGGTTYPIAQWNKDMREIDGYKIRSSKKDVTLLLDKMGNALLAKDVGSSNNWIVVGDYYQAAGTSGRVGWFVHGWTIKGDEVDLELGTIRGAAEKYAPGELVKYRVAEEGNGEYELVKPMYATDDASNANYPNGRRVLKNGGVSSWVEPLGSKDGDVQTGEGIYNVAQYAKQGGTDQKYSISSRNTLLPLEFYDTHPSRRTEVEMTAAGAHKKYSATSNLTEVGADIANTDTNEFYGNWNGSTANYDKWTYRPGTYDGVKFIFVGFDPANGEVDTINVLDGVQNVAYEELIQINRWWKNVGTNNEEFVASPAEAYVDKNGKVKAVVIKSDSAEASLKDLMIITDNRGANTSVKSTGAEAPTSGTYYTRQYVSGEDGFKEEKTGYFDRMLSVGTVVTGRLDSNNVFKTRTFHPNEYTNRNPDGFYAKGIKPLETNEGKKSDYAFYVGPENGGGIVEYLGTGIKGNGKDLIKPADENSAGAKILTSLDVMGIDTPVKKEGLIKVDSTTQFIDLRDGRPGDINELGDLFDGDKCDNTKVELKILVNGNVSSDGFRHAYVIMILNAKPEADDADEAGITITGRVDGKSKLKDNVAANDGKTEATAWTWTVEPGAEVVLTARVTATGTAENMKWTNVSDKNTVLSDTDSVEVVAGEDGEVQILKFYVENYDPNHANSIRTPATRYVKIVSKAAAAPDASGSVVKAAGDAEDLIKVGKFNVNPPTSAGETTWNANITLPDWATKVTAAQVKFDYRVLKNGVKVVDTNGTKIAATSQNNGTAVFGATTRGAGLIAGDEITIEIYDVEFLAVNIKYQDKAGADITAQLVKDSSAEVATVASDSASVVNVVTADSDNNHKPTMTIKSGATGTISVANYATGKFVGTFSTVAATGDQAVVIEVDTSKLENLVSITLDATSGANAALKLNTLGVAGATDNETITLSVLPASGKADDTLFALQATLANGGTAEFHKYFVTVDGFCTNVEISGTTARTIWNGTLSEAKTIKASDVHVSVVEKLVVKSAKQTDASTIVVTFNEDVATGLSAALTTGTGLAVTNVEVDGKTATLTLAGAVANSQVITLTGKQAGDDTNTLVSPKTIVASATAAGVATWTAT